VHIEQITSDRKLRWQNLWGAAASNLRLPALSRDLQIDYTALSFVAPEKVRFRVKLEGHDPDWITRLRARPTSTPRLNSPTRRLTAQRERKSVCPAHRRV